MQPSGGTEGDGGRSLGGMTLGNPLPDLDAVDWDRLAAGDVVVLDPQPGNSAAQEFRAALAPLLPGLRPAGTGATRARDSEVRGDVMAWLEPVGPGAAVHAAFAALGTAATRELRLGRLDCEVQLAAYAEGARYVRHRDALRGRPGRILTAILYLNPEWQPADGGELRIHPTAGPPRDIAPAGGRLVLFRSDLVEHEVLPAHRLRMAVTAWYRPAGA